MRHQTAVYSSADLAAGIRRVKGAKRLGCRVSNWLSLEQSRKLVTVTSGSKLRDVRNRAILAMLNLALEFLKPFL
jgi:hypothetical protein